MWREQHSLWKHNGNPRCRKEIEQNTYYQIRNFHSTGLMMMILDMYSIIRL